MINAVKYRSGPKRAISKMYCQETQGVTAAAQGVVLNDPDKTNTLVRTILHARFYTDAAGVCTVCCGLYIRPNSTNVYDPAVADIAAEDRDENHVAQRIFTLNSNAFNERDVVEITFDITGMRKLKKGEEYVFWYIGNAADVVNMNMDCTTFYKEG